MEKLALVLTVVMIFIAGCQSQSQPVDDTTQEPVQQEQPVQETDQADQSAQQNQNTQNENTISESKAKSIALKDAGLSESKVEHISAHLDRDDGRLEYEVDFYTSTTEYDYTLDATNGTILEKDQEAREPYDD